MLKEACVENFTNVPGVIERGAKRIELCDNLAVGGTTPSIGVIKITAEYCSDKDASIIVILRPRGGDFVYSAYGKSHHDAGFRRNNSLACQWYSGRSFNRSRTHLDKPFLEEIAKLAIAIMEPSLFSIWRLIKYRKTSKETHYYGCEKLVLHGF
jgi:copper homeostasis protein